MTRKCHIPHIRLRTSQHSCYTLVERAVAERTQGTWKFPGRRPACSSGFLFFGTITHTETNRTLFTESSWVHAQIRFLVVDFGRIPGIDFSAAEAFVRAQPLLSGQRVVLVLCSAGDRKVLRALSSVGLLELMNVKLFVTFNDALGWKYTCLDRL
jgi:MFS superfamily sulfate permease-like transporter